MKRILILVAISLFLCSTASAAQGGGGESTKKKAKKTSGTKSVNTTPPRPTAPPARPNTPTIASVMVNSNLPNVTVTINGRTAGTTDSNGSMAIGSMKPGVYTVSVTKPGYLPEKLNVTLSAGQSETLYFELKPITQSLTISSTPSECEIYIDDVLRGRTDASGSLRLAGLPVGEHSIAVRKSRYKETVLSLSLSPDKDGEINANLELAVGFLTVTTNAPNPSIDISGLGHFENSLNKFECQPGTYSVTISSPMYLTSKKEVRVSAGEVAQLSVDLEVDSEARSRLTSETLEAYSSKQYDRAINLARALLSANPKHSQALSVLAESYFMKDDFNSFVRFGNQAIESGGRLEIPLRHHHVTGGTYMHPIRLVLTAQTISFDPQIPNYPPGPVVNMIFCTYKPFTVSLRALGSADLSTNIERFNRLFLHLVFVDPNNPKKTDTLNFRDRESDPQNYVGFNVIRPPALVAIAALMNNAKAVMRVGIESSMAANKAPEVILETRGSDPAVGAAPMLPTVEAIIEANIKAAGNPAKWTTAILKGTYTYTITENGNSISGDFEEYLKGRTKFFYVFKNEKIGSLIEGGYDTGVGWYKIYKKKPSRMSATALASVKRNLTMNTLIDVKEFNEIYPVSNIKGKGKLGELDVYVVETIPSVGRLETFYFDTTTGLLMRQDSKYEDPEKRGVLVTTKVIYDGYIDVDGTKIPTGWREVSPSLTISVTISDTKLDVPIDDSKFKMPAK